MLQGRSFDNLLRNHLGVLLCTLALSVGCGEDGASLDPGAFDSGASPAQVPDAATTGGGGTTGGGMVTPTPDGGGITFTTPDSGGVVPAVDSGLPTMGVDAGAGADAAAMPDGEVLGDAMVGDAMLGDDAMAEDAMVPHEDLGKGDGKDVIMIGDSWMSNTLQIEGTNGGISTSILSMSKQPYRNYAVQGVMLLQDDAFGPAIPTQWDDAVQANSDIKTVIMTGGGNDIIQGPQSLQDSCAQGTDECAQTLTKIGTTLADLWANKMAKAGVQDIIHVLYAKVAGNVKNIDDNNKALEALCSKVPAPTRCHIVATDDLAPDTSALAIDGIHPVKATNDKIAQRILDLMEQEGIRR